MSETNIPFIFAAISINFLLGLLIAVLGRRLPKDGKWLAVTGCVLVLIAGLMELVDRFQGFFNPTKFSFQWLDEYLQVTPIIIGVYSNPSATILVSLFALVALVWMVGLTSISQGDRPQNVYASLLFSLFGIGLAWYSVTPWTTIVGIMCTVLACGLLKEMPNKEAEKQFSPYRFWIDHGIGILLIFIGILWTWFGFPTMRYDGPVDVLVVDTLNVALIFIFLGFLFILRFLPGVSWITANFGNDVEVGKLIKLSIPPIAGLAIFFQLTNTFRLDFIYPFLGSSAFVVAIVLLILGAMLRNSFELRRLMLPVSYLLVMGVFFVGSPIAAMTILAAVVLLDGLMVVYSDAEFNERNRVKAAVNREWIDIVMRVLFLTSSTMIPVSLIAAGWVMIHSKIWSEPATFYPCAVLFFLWNVCLFRLYGFKSLHKGRWEIAGGILSILLILIGASWFWLELPLSGFGLDWISTVDENVKNSFLARLTEVDADSFSLGEGNLVLVVLPAILLVAAAIGYWLNRINLTDRLEKSGISKVYRNVVLIEPLLRQLKDAFLVSFRQWENIIVQEIWKGQLFEWIGKSIISTGKNAREFLEKIFEYLSKGVFVVVNRSAEGVQLIQNGSFQRYIVTGMVSVMFLVLLILLGS